MPRCLPSTPAALSVVDKVNIGGAVAPVLRRRTITRRRPIHVVNGEGKIVRVSDDIEVAKGVLAHAGIAFSVTGTPTVVPCARCRAMFSREPTEKFTALCSSCRKSKIVCEVRARLKDDEMAALDEYIATTTVDIVRPTGTWEGVFGWLVRAVRNSTGSPLWTTSVSEQGRHITVLRDILIRLTQDERDILDTLIKRADRALQKTYGTASRFSMPMSFGRSVRLVLMDGELLPGEDPTPVSASATPAA